MRLKESTCATPGARGARTDLQPKKVYYNITQLSHQ